MFCNKTNVNILTAHLLAHGIEDAVVCPGSRNAVIVHNFNECAQSTAPAQTLSEPTIEVSASVSACPTPPTADSAAPFRLHPVTDERSAAFVAIGLWLATRKPVAVCVTSGSALLNLLPGVAEAYYRHIPLILISADRPAEWIGQLDGQTLPQPDALLPYAKCWNLPDDAPEAQLHSLCRDALGALTANGGSCIHINVPLHEPLFEFTTPRLPQVPPYEAHAESLVAPLPPDIIEALNSAQHPALIIGQWEEAPIPAVATLQQHGWTIFAENISNHNIYCDTLPTEGIDLLVHIGGALVEKHLKLQLRQMPQLTIIRIDETNESPKTFGHVEHKLKAHPSVALQQIAEVVCLLASPIKFSASPTSPELPDYSLKERGARLAALFLANSTAVRWANQHLRIPVPTYCNRGVNGIEGSLSVAAGYSLATSEPILCLIGDLSFFYDANALWNQHLSSSLRILLINNNKGGIFYRLPQLDQSPALDNYIAASHTNDACGIAQSYRCAYISTTTTDLAKDIETLLSRLLDEPSERPVILEVSLQS